MKNSDIHWSISENFKPELHIWRNEEQHLKFSWCETERVIWWKLHHQRISVHTKLTDTGLYTNFKPHTPENYRTSVVKTLVTRAIRYLSTTNTCLVELDRLRQLFVNNGYPQTLVDKKLNNKLSQYLSNDSNKLLRPVIQHHKLQSRRTSLQSNTGKPPNSNTSNCKTSNCNTTFTPNCN